MRAFFALVATILLTLAAGISPSAADGHERVVLDGAHADQQYVAGEEVRIEAEVTDDIFAAGYEVVFDGATGEDLIAAGRRVTFRRTTAQDVIVAGADVDFAGEITDDLVGAGRRVHLRHDSVIGDDARLAAGDLDIEGRIGGDLDAVAELITLSGEVAGDVDLLARRIVLAPGARIGGKLTYRSRSEADIAADAVVAGGVERLEIEDFDELEKVRRRGPLVGLGAWLVGVLALIVLGAGLHLALPNLLTGAVAAMNRNPWSTLGVGFALFVVTPVAAMFLVFTVIGLPLALMGLAAYAVSLGLGLITAATWLGGRIRRWVGRGTGALDGWGRVLWAAVGIVALSVLGAIPFLGGLALLFAVLFGLGALAPQAWRRLRSPTATAT